MFSYHSARSASFISFSPIHGWVHSPPASRERASDAAPVRSHGNPRYVTSSETETGGFFLSFSFSSSFFPFCPYRFNFRVSLSRLLTLGFLFRKRVAGTYVKLRIGTAAELKIFVLLGFTSQRTTTRCTPTNGQGRLYDRPHSRLC